MNKLTFQMNIIPFNEFYHAILNITLNINFQIIQHA